MIPANLSCRSLPAPARRSCAAATLVTLLGTSFTAVADDEFVPLFNGQDLEGWYTWDKRYGKDNDVENYYQVRDGELVVLDIPESEEDKAFGYIATVQDHADYHLRFEYRWGTRKFAPRQDRLRDSGVLYHLIGNDRIWPTTLESQVQEGDTGDFFALGGTSITTTADGRLYSPTGEARDPGCCVTASQVADTLDGWNRSEVVVRGDSAVHIVNGQVVNRLWDARADGQPLRAGRIAFQAEGATIRYRNIELRKLGSDTPRVLLFSETRGYRHGSIANALEALEELAASAGIETVRAADSSAIFTDANLADYDAVAWVMTTGDVLNDQEQAAFEHYIRSGGGYVGLHAASDTEYAWPWYGDLVGAWFKRHPSVQTARQEVEDDEHPSTAHLGASWTRTDEWYDFRRNPRGKVNVLLSLQESSYSGGGMGDDHPIAWYHEHDGGRAWYTGGGHTSASYAEPKFRAHLLGGLRYAAGLAGEDGGPPPVVPDPDPNPGPDPTPEPQEPAPAIPADALDRAGWIVSASHTRAGEGAAKAIDADARTRWSTGVTQSPGMRFDIDLGEHRGIDGIVLDAGPEATDDPRGYEVRISDDGIDFSRTVARGTERGRGTVIGFAPVGARYLRLVQTGSDDVRWWSIHEVHVSGAELPGPATDGDDPDPPEPAPAIPADALDRAGWIVSASHSRAGEGAAKAIDADARTRWSTGVTQSPGMRFDIDLGEHRGIDGIVLDAGPEATDDPRGYEVRISDDGIDFSRIVARGTERGRGTVIGFAPVGARYLRLVQTGSDDVRWWSIHEVHVSGAELPGPATDGDDIAFVLVDAGLDADLGALTDGMSIDIEGIGAFSVRALPPVGTRSMTFALSGAASHSQTENYAAWALFGNSGQNFAGRPASPGRYTLRARAHSEQSGAGDTLAETQVVFTLQDAGSPPPEEPVSTPLSRDGWTASASSVRRGETTAAAFDDSSTSRWSTGTRQVPDQYFQIDLGSARRFDRIVLATSDVQPFDFPRGFEVRVSDDGQDFGAVIASGVGSATTDIRLDPVTARYLRITQTGEDVYRWWSIYDAKLFVDR